MKKSARPVHYAAAGRASLVFDCYRQAMTEHVESPQIVIGPKTRIYPRLVHTIPTPRSHTDLRKVTCRECWRQISRLAAGRLSPARVLVEEA